MDLLAKQPTWSTPEQAGEPETVAQPRLWSIPRVRPAMAFVLAAALGLAMLGWALLSASGPAALPLVRSLDQQAFDGPYGTVVLHDWSDGRTWLSWYRANQWVGAPLWADRPWRQHASCSAFLRGIVCPNPDGKAAGTAWHLLGLRLGTQAMQDVGLRPDPGSLPASIVAAYLMRLRQSGVDVHYRFGLPQSPPVQTGATMAQFYERALFTWPVGSSDPADIQLAPLGQLAVANSW